MSPHVPTLLLLAGLMTASAVQAADSQAIEPKCDKPFDYNADTKSCKPGAGFTDLKSENCTGSFGSVSGDQCTPPAADKIPKPNCGDGRFRFKDGKCYLDDSTPRSSEGDYVGDCFTIRGVTPPCVMPAWRRCRAPTTA